jgi:hypothetical protein
MAQSAVKTYKRNNKKKRHLANIQNLISEKTDNEQREPISAFEALFAKNIKGFKSKSTRKDCKNKENIKDAKHIPCKRKVDTKLGIINERPCDHDSTFDQISAGPV